VQFDRAALVDVYKLCCKEVQVRLHGHPNGYSEAVDRFHSPVRKEVLSLRIVAALSVTEPSRSRDT